MGVDLAKLDTVSGANQGFELQLLDPGTLANLGIFIQVLGRDSAEFRKLAADQNRRRIAKVTRGGQFRAGAASLEEMESDGIELLAECTKGWRSVELDKDDPTIEQSKPFLTIGGEEVQFSRAAAVKLYTNYPWIREQVDGAVIDRANFIKR